MKNRKNVYICPACGHGFVSLDVDEGVTPFMSPCLACGQMAHSLCYKIPDALLGAPAVEWYRPDAEFLARATSATRGHVEMGGLISRRTGAGKHPATCECGECWPMEAGGPKG